MQFIFLHFSLSSGCTSLRGAQVATAGDNGERRRRVADQLPSVMVDTAESCSEMEENGVEGESLLSLVRHALGGDGAHVGATIDKKEKEEKDKVEPSIELNRLPNVSMCLMC